jgi:multimeric flavodoxin WrbA
MSEKQLKVVAFNGSARKGGNTAILLRAALQELEAGDIATELIEMAGCEIHGCRACYKCSARHDRRCSQDNDDGNKFIAKLEEADGVLLGSPVYVSDITAEMKALIDRACLVNKNNEGFLRRKAGAGIVVARRAGSIHAFDSLNHFFLISEMIVPGSTYWNIGIGREKGDAEHDAEGLQTMRTLGKNMAWLLKKINS